MSKITRGLALAGACLAGLAVAAPANAHTLKLGAVGATRASAQAPVAVNAPIRVLSPGQNGHGASSTSQSNGNRSASAQAPIAVNAPIRVLSPGRNGNGASSTSQSNGKPGRFRPGPDRRQRPHPGAQPGSKRERCLQHHPAQRQPKCLRPGPDRRQRSRPGAQSWRRRRRHRSNPRRGSAIGTPARRVDDRGPRGRRCSDPRPQRR